MPGGRPKGSKDSKPRQKRSNGMVKGRGKEDIKLAPLMRKSFINGFFEYSKRKGKGLTACWADFIEEDWKTAFTIAAKFMPKEVDAKIEHIGLTDALKDIEARAEIDRKGKLDRPAIVEGEFREVD